MNRLYLILGFFFCSFIAFSQNYDAELTLHKTKIEVKKGKLTKKILYEIKINNRAGERYARVQIPFSKLIKLKKLKAYIKDANGKVIKKLKKRDIVEKSAISDFSFYEDDFVQEFTLKHNVYPYTLVYSYKTQEKEFLNIDYWLPIINSQIPTRNAELEVSVPKDYKIIYKNQLVDKPQIDTVKNKIVYQWKTSYTNLVKSESYSPPMVNFLPKVVVNPIHFHFDKNGSLKDWKSFGNWQYELLQGLNELPEMEKYKIENLLENIDDDKEKIRVLYHYLQDETRYINVTLETGGLKPYSATYVAKNKFGDCKALTNYFKAMLEYINIPAYYTKIYAGNPILKVDKNFPSQQSNHIILYVPLKDEDIWLDCTSDGAFNYLGTFTQNRDAFLVSKDSSRFVKTPKLKPIDNLKSRKIEVGFNPPNSANVKVATTYNGDWYEDISQINRNYNDADKLRIIRKYFVENGFQLKDYKITSYHRDTTTIKLSYNATTQNIYKNYGNDILINNILFDLPYFAKPKTRKLPVQLDYPIYQTDTISYEIPNGYKLNKNSVHFSVNTKYGKYKLDINKKENRIIVTKSLLIYAGYYSVEEYKDFYSFYYRVLELENTKHITFSK